METATQKFGFDVVIEVRVNRRELSAANLVAPEPLAIKAPRVAPSHPWKGKKPQPLYGFTSASIKMMRSRLDSPKWAEMLTNEQQAALDAIGVTANRDLTDGQKQQILNIYNDVCKSIE